MISGGRTGIYAEHGASVDLRGGLSVTGNTQVGVFLLEGTRMRMQNTTISGNGTQGILAARGSSVEFIGPANVVSGNGQVGLQCDPSSRFIGNVVGGNTPEQVNCQGWF